MRFLRSTLPKIDAEIGLDIAYVNAKRVISSPAIGIDSFVCVTISVKTPAITKPSVPINKHCHSQ